MSVALFIFIPDRGWIADEDLPHRFLNKSFAFIRGYTLAFQYHCLMHFMNQSFGFASCLLLYDALEVGLLGYQVICQPAFQGLRYTGQCFQGKFSLTLVSFDAGDRGLFDTESTSQLRLAHMQSFTHGAYRVALRQHGRQRFSQGLVFSINLASLQI